MDLDLFSIILIGLIGLMVGALAGGAIYAMLAPKSGKAGEQSKGMAEAARLWRDQRSGRLVVEVEGKTAQTVENLSAAQRARLAQALDEALIWLGQLRPISPASGEPFLPSKAQVAPTLVAQPKPDLSAIVKLEPSASPSGTAPSAATVRIEGNAAFPASGEATLASAPSPAGLSSVGEKSQPAAALIQEIEPMEEVKPPGMIDILARAIGGDPKKARPPTLSVAAQVDEILQERLANSRLRDRNIRLVELPDRGMVVMVGEAEYDGVSEVPDEAVREILKDCVSEWEKRNYGY